MVGFSLKKNDNGPKKSGFGGFSLKKKEISTSKPLAKVKQFSKDEDDDETKEEKIDTFDSDKGGAFNKETGPEKPKEQLVIKNAGNQNWRKITKERFNPSSKQVQQEPDKKLSYGINIIETEKQDKSESSSILNREAEHFKEDVESRPDVATLEEYEEIPVEDFGAAMLRGMGWKDDDDDDDKSKKKEVIPLVKRTPYLGLGATDVSIDDSKSKDKSYVPVKRVDRRTGQQVNERERSPQRAPINYRNRD